MEELTKYDQFDMLYDRCRDGEFDLDEVVKRYLRCLAGFSIDSSDLDTDENMWPFQ